MNPILRNILGVLAGVLAGGMLNMGIILISGSIIPPPEGTDMTTTEGLKAAMHLMEAKHFIMPFLAHALGSLLGAFVAAKLVATHKMKFAIGVGIWFFLGGVSMVFMMPSPLWFTVLDLGVAYIPMAYFGGMLATNNQVKTLQLL
ncbi:MAG TPA: hypothetical protein PK218_09905 [Flavobacterium sp.]|nr:hypothetical protein [Flavobacterium sp.]